MMQPKSNKIQCIPFYNRCQGKNEGLVWVKRQGREEKRQQRYPNARDAERFGLLGVVHRLVCQLGDDAVFPQAQIPLVLARREGIAAEHPSLRRAFCEGLRHTPLFPRRGMGQQQGRRDWSVPEPTALSIRRGTDTDGLFLRSGSA